MRRPKFIAAMCLTGLVLLCCGNTAPGAADAPADLPGKYHCEGKDFDGDKYSGEVTIAKNGDTYLLQWDVTFKVKGRAKYAGVGLLTDGTLSASWEGQARAGVIAYKVGKDGDLSGRWTIIRNRGTMTEQLTRAKQ